MPDPQDWRQTLPEDIRGHEALKDVADIPTLAKSYIEKSAAPPPEAKVVLPESPDKYELTIPKFEGIDKPTDEINSDLNDIRKFGFDMKLSKEAVQSLVDRYAKDYSEEYAKAKSRIEEMLSPLKKEWGSKYDSNLAEANLAVNRLGGDELMEVLQASGLHVHPTIIRLFHKLLPLVSESAPGRGDSHPGVSQTGKSPEEILYPNHAR